MARLVILTSIAGLTAAYFYFTTPVTNYYSGVPNYFAQIDAEGNVLRVIVATQEVINTGSFGDPTNWIPTDPQGLIKTNPAVIGGTYDRNADAFIPPKPYPSWVLNEQTKTWQPPKQHPGTKAGVDFYVWDEVIQDYKEIKDVRALPL